MIVSKGAITDKKLYVRPGRIFTVNGQPDTMYIERPVDGVPVYMGLESAHSRGAIGCTEYQWLRLRHSVGRWTRSVLSGVRRVLRTIGTGRTA